MSCGIAASNHPVDVVATPPCPEVSIHLPPLELIITLIFL